MSQSPDVATSAQEEGLLNGDKGGYVLFGHDNTPDGVPEGNVDYLRFSQTMYAYTVTADAEVIQVNDSSD